jgi:HK97 family phage portal protein
VAGLLDRLTDVFNGGPIIRRHHVERRVYGDRLAELLEWSRGMRVYSGVPVNDDQAMRLSAVWRCVDLIGELVSTLPLDEYRRVGDRAPEQLTPSVLLTDPAGDGYGTEVWLRQVMMSGLLRGNVFGFVTDVGEDFWPNHIEVIHPDRVHLRRDKDQGPVTWFLDNNEIDRWPAGQLWHIPVYPIPGTPLGLSPIRYAAETVGLGLAVQRFGAQWFGDGAHPTSILKGEGPISESEAKLLKARIIAATRDNREPLVLGGGYSLEAIQVAPEESQFLETIKATAEDINGFFFRRPPGEGGQVTYANVEARSLDLLTYTLNGWLVRLERALSRLLPRGRYVKFNADALLRVDLKTRYEAHVLAVRGGIATPNERRGIEDLAPLPDEHADELLWPPFTTSSGTPLVPPPEGDANADGQSQPA